jgi:hypothetical protein
VAGERREQAPVLRRIDPGDPVTEGNRDLLSVRAEGCVLGATDPVRRSVRIPVATSHTAAVPSAFELTSDLPSGENETASTWPV